jgi:chaperonin cofactor prefoldin
MAPPSYAPVPAQQTMPAVPQLSSKDIEIVSVKIDNVRQQLDMMNHRLDRIESMLERRYG